MPRGEAVPRSGFVQVAFVENESSASHATATTPLLLPKDAERAVARLLTGMDSGPNPQRPRNEK